jgi:acetolactate synthase-1/2/3 large subunit
MPLVGDAKLTLLALVSELSHGRSEPPPASDAAARVAALRDRIRTGLEAQGRATELGLLETIEHSLPADAITVWDMTILGYWAAPHLRLAAGQQFLYPLGSGTLGYAWPAAIGAAVAHPERPVLAVMGDGGLQYTRAELGTAAQHEIGAKLLVVDDGGYGILREYQSAQFGQTTSVELPDKNIEAMAGAFNVPVRTATAEDLAEHLRWALDSRGPAVVVLRRRIVAAQPTS